MLFEFICGGVPFGEGETDPYIIYERVLERNVKWPRFVDKTEPIKLIIDQLMHKNPVMRMPGGITEFKTNKWFNDIDFEAILMKG